MGCSDSNTSCFILLADNIRSRCWWYSSGGWTFLPIFCCRVTDGSKRALWQNGIWQGSTDEAKGCHWILLLRKKWHPLRSINACWKFLETNQWMWAQWSSGWWVSAAVTATWKTSHVLDGHTQLSHDEIRRAYLHKLVDSDSFLQLWILALMHWKRWWQG